MAEPETRIKAGSAAQGRPRFWSTMPPPFDPRAIYQCMARLTELRTEKQANTPLPLNTIATRNARRPTATATPCTNL
jgi:hypothetical protein